MTRLFINIWPFATMKSSPIMSQQSRLSILPNRKWTFKNLPKICKFLPNWWNYAKTGHTDLGLHTQALIKGAFQMNLFFLFQDVSRFRSNLRGLLPSVQRGRGLPFLQVQIHLPMELFSSIKELHGFPYLEAK